MSDIHALIKGFLAALTKVSERLRSFESEVSDRQERIVAAIEVCGKGLASSPPRGKAKELAAAHQEYARELANRLRDWQERAKQQIKDREFIGRFDKSLIVMVYGKVNSGKSALGNFLSGTDLADLPASPYKDLPRPVFHVHATAEQSYPVSRLAELPEGFEVKATEATNCIQEFTLSGMSWVDTPGIHSMTEANVALARQYVENAELVIYLTNSDSPLRGSDLVSLRELRRLDKPILIVVSKFDTTDEDTDDAGNLVTRFVPKDAQAKREQQEWIERQVREGGLAKILQDRRYAFISVRVAREALKTRDLGLFQGTGLPALYAQLGSVLTEKAVELKKTNPRRKVNALIDEIVGHGVGGKSLQAWQETFHQQSLEISRKREALLERHEHLVQAVLSACDRAVEKLLSEEAARVESGQRVGTKLRQELKSVIGAAVREQVALALEGELRTTVETLDQGLRSIAFSDVEAPDLTRKWDTITVSTEAVSRGVGGALGGAGGAAAGAWAGAAIGTAVPVIGNIVGGIVGGILGGLFGGVAGGAIGGVGAGTKDIQVAVGTNRQELRDLIMRQLREGMPEVIAKVLENFAKEWYDPLKLLTANVEARLATLHRQLQEQRF